MKISYNIQSDKKYKKTSSARELKISNFRCSEHGFIIPKPICPKCESGGYESKKCQCPEKGTISSASEFMYSDSEKLGMNHEPNECNGTNEIRLYSRGNKELYLCSCCWLFGDKLQKYES